MRILQVITSLHTGGAETLVVNLTPKFRAMGHEVDVCVFNGAETLLMERFRKENPHSKIIKLGSGHYNPLYILKLAKIMKHYDVVHTHNSSPQLFVALARVLCSVELVSTEHTTSNRKRGWKWYAPIESWMYNQYNHIICISKIAEEKLREYMGGSWLIPTSDKYHKISTINNGVDVETIYNTPPLATDKKGFVTTMVAGFRDAKDQDTLVRMLQHLPSDHEVWLVGDGERKDTVEQLAKQLNVAHRVKFWGLRSDVPAILRASDAICMSSHWEGLSLSNVEGMSAGKPFIASNVNGLREVTDGYGLLFPHEDDKALAEIIQKLSEDKTYYNQIAERCYQRAKQFDINTMAAKYNEVYLALQS